MNASLHKSEARQPEDQTPTIVASDIVSREELLFEIDEKMNRVREFLAERALGGVLITGVNNFSWITAGVADNHIVLTSETGAASLLLMQDGRKYLIANDSEAPRLMAEDLRGLGYEAQGYDWYEQKNKLRIIREIAGGERIGSDLGFDDLPVVDLAPLRFRLLDSELNKYRWLGRHTAEAIESVCRVIEPGMSEREIEAMASDALMRSGIRPTVLLIGVDERIYNYRHATPSDWRLVKYAMVNVCARRWGLIVAATRFVHFGILPEELKTKLRAAAYVNAQFQAHTRPRMKASELFEMAKRWYLDCNFPDEWRRHHQGGAIGYAEREWLAAPDCYAVVETPQGFAWNPTVQGAKVEDTIIAFEDRVENITATDGFPSLEVEVNDRLYRSPDILIR